MQYLHSDNAPSAIGPYSQAISIDGMIYTSGQIALKTDGTMVENDIKLQTKQVFSNLRGVLEDNNSSFSKVVKVNIFLTDLNNFNIVNQIMIEEFGEHKPARSTIEVKALPKNALVEIDMVACLN